MFAHSTQTQWCGIFFEIFVLNLDDREKKIIYTIYVNVRVRNIFGNRIKTWNKDWFWYDEICHISMDIFRNIFISNTSIGNSAFYFYQFIYSHRSTEPNDSCNVNKWIFGRLSKPSMNIWWYKHNLVDDFYIRWETITNNCGIEFYSRCALLLLQNLSLFICIFNGNFVLIAVMNDICYLR